MLKHLSNKIREKVLSGKWPAETAAESQMLKDFRASKMSVKEFLKEILKQRLNELLKDFLKGIRKEESLRKS